MHAISTEKFDDCTSPPLRGFDVAMMLCLDVARLPYRADPPPTLDRPGAFACEPGGQRKYLGLKKQLLTFCLQLRWNGVLTNRYCSVAHLWPRALHLT